MEELLSKTGHKIQTFEKGEKIDAKLLEISDNLAIFDVGGKSEGVLIDSQFEEAEAYLRDLKRGDEIKATVIDPEVKDGSILLSVRDHVYSIYWDKLEKANKKNKPVKVKIKYTSDKGINVELGPLTGFVPHSQVGKDLANKLDEKVGKKIKAVPIEINREKNRIVLSERAVSEKEEIEKLQKAYKSIKQDQIYEATVKQLTGFGAFVEINIKSGKSSVPIEGLVHVSEIAWDRVNKPSDVLDIGDKVKVKVIKKEEIGERYDIGRLAFSIKGAMEDPWDTITKKYKKDQKLKGTVEKISDFGAFVQLEPGVEGLLHITKIPPGKELKVGQEVTCYIEDVDKDERRIALGLVLTQKPVGYK